MAASSKAFVVLLIGGSCIGFAPVLVRMADVGPVASAFWRMSLAAPMLWIAVAIRNRLASASANLSARTTADASAGAAPHFPWQRAVWLAGLFFAADLGTWHVSITQTTVANATLLANCAPILVTIYTLVVLRQPPSGRFLGALALAMAGAVALVSPKLQMQGAHLRGDVLALVAACFYTAYMLAIKQARDRYDTLRLMALTTSITAVALLPAALLLSQWSGQAFWPTGYSGWSIALALAVVTQCAGQGCIAYALAHLPVTLSTTGLLIQPVVAAAAAWWLFGEQLGSWQLVGALVLLLGIALARRESV